MASKIFFKILLGLLSIQLYGQNVECKLMTYNIRLDTADDGEDNWHKRKDELCQFVIDQHLDFLGVQEALFHQVNYIDSSLKDFDYIGVGRDDGITGGEFMAIYYQKDRWRLLEDSTIWFSATPNLPSRGWDAGCHRVMTIGKFANLANDTLYVLNTHFDHVGVEARQKSALIINEFLSTISREIALILMGDFNLTPDDAVYQELIMSLFDTYDGATRLETISKGTFNGFKLKEVHDRRIDYLFVNEYVTTLKHQVPEPKTSMGRQLSDHFPVIAEVKIK
jgi:endonuclease/exonuclease/phosphatase family metal-dependent hydrolase